MDVEKTSSMLMRCDPSTQLNEPWESQSIMWIYGEYAKLSQKYNWKWDSFLGSMFQRQTTSVQQNVVYCVEVEALLMARALAMIVEVAICCMNGMSFGSFGREWPTKWNWRRFATRPIADCTRHRVHRLRVRLAMPGNERAAKTQDWNLQDWKLTYRMERFPKTLSQYDTSRDGIFTYMRSTADEEPSLI